MKYRLLATLTLACAASGGAYADDALCTVPEAQWRPQESLQTKLEAEGWKIKRIKIDDGCYEVYGIDSDGKRMETYFDPKTFVAVKSEQED